jgi:hypothetical protein
MSKSVRPVLVALLLASGSLIQSCGQSAFADRSLPMPGTMQQVEAVAATALQQAGWHVQSHEFNANTEGKITATSPNGASVEFSYKPAHRGDVLLQARTSGATEQECAANASQLLKAVEAAVSAAGAK